MVEIPGLERKTLATGVRYLKLHHYADPAKGSDWLEKVRVEMQDTPDDFRTQILMDENVYGGLPVLTMFDALRHKIPGRIQAVPISIYISGWDCGQTLSPAFALKQIHADTLQVQSILELTGTGESMETFAPRVKSTCERFYPGIFPEIRHHGDATVVTRSGSDGRSAKDVAREFGIVIQEVSNVWAGRYAAMVWLLNRIIEGGMAGFVVSSETCPILTAALEGAYKWESSSRGESGGPGQVILRPLKNEFSHIADAFGYAAVAIKAFIEGRGGDIPITDASVSNSESEFGGLATLGGFDGGASHEDYNPLGGLTPY